MPVDHHTQAVDHTHDLHSTVLGHALGEKSADAAADRAADAPKPEMEGGE
ncbi:MAG: hypothetical protein ACYDD1_04920 [Caulobacteraceae bacterium]